ncbi:GNAT family N-acetyltransferase [Streptomyces sp. NPDC096080]|uniref:GNAT family N-acetyltransferase n=1 Tax=Streptomyces sp. NPDC096080 TaxID=3156693 RepID=UPI00331E1D4B
MSVSDPTIGELLDFHFECLQGMYFSDYRQIEGGALLFSGAIKDPYYNFFAPGSPGAAASLPAAIEEEFLRRGRQPALYITPQARPADASGAEPEAWARDAWLVGDTAALATPETGEGNLRLRTVGREDREVYVATFTAAYSGDDPDDPYGNLDSAYSESLRASFDNSVPGYRKHYVMATLDDQPVGVATILTAGGIAGVYGVGTLPARRRAGIGSAIMRYLARVADADGATHLMLQTEAGSTVQRWYESLGYRHVFDASYITVASKAGA